jgi:hypothetical protein
MTGMMFVRATSPSGYDLGWVRPELIVAVTMGGRYFQFKDGDRIVDAMGEPELVKRACGIRD